MTLSFKILGHEIWTLELEVKPEEIAANTIQRGVKSITKLWMKGLT